MGENTSGPPTFAYMVDEQQMLHDMSEVEAVLTDSGQLGSSHHHPTQVMVGGQLMNLVTTSGHPAGTVHMTSGGRIMLLNSMLTSAQGTVLDGGGRLLTLCGDGATTEGGVEVMVLRNAIPQQQQQQQPPQQQAHQQHHINSSSSTTINTSNTSNISLSGSNVTTIIPTAALTPGSIIAASVSGSGTCYVSPGGGNSGTISGNFTSSTATTTTATASNSRSSDVTVFKRVHTPPAKVEVKKEEDEEAEEDPGARRRKGSKKAGGGRSVARRNTVSTASSSATTTKKSPAATRTRPAPFCSPTDQAPMVVIPGGAASVTVTRNPMDELPHTHHLTKSQVEGLFMILGPHYTNPGRRAPLKDFVLASLVLLSTKDSYREMSERMVFKSRGWMHKTIHLFCQMMVKYLSSLIEWPSGDDAKQVVNAFQNIGGIPGVIGAMDTSHMAITKAPVGKSSSLYANPLQFHSIHLMAVSDYRYRFTYVNVGRPGSFHEAKVFKRSSLCQIVEEDPHSIFPASTHIIAGPGFPLSDQVLTPYPEHHAGAGALNPLGRHQKQFNMKLMHTKKAIDLAFQLLRARWQRLKCLEMQQVSNMSIAIKTCCILHNICLSNPGYEELLVTPDMEEERHIPVDYVGTHPYSAIRKRDMVALYVDGQEAWGGA